MLKATLKGPQRNSQRPTRSRPRTDQGATTSTGNRGPIFSPERAARKGDRRLERNFRCLFRELASRQRRAEREQLEARTSERIKRELNSFRIDHPATCTREDAQILLERIDDQLDDSPYADQLRLTLRTIGHRHGLYESQTEPVPDLATFLADLTSVAYQEAHLAQHPTAEPAEPAEPAEDVAVHEPDVVSEAVED